MKIKFEKNDGDEAGPGRLYKAARVVVVAHM
jgi:hypothetical protein